MPTIKTIEWKNNTVIMLDQRALPEQEVYKTFHDYKGVADAIRDMVIRGAPAIGVAAAMGFALGAQGIGVDTYNAFMERLRGVYKMLFETRPTAVNLQWALNRMMTVAEQHRETPIAQIIAALQTEALQIYHEDLETNRQIGQQGAVLFADGDGVLTHCNAGALATAGHGTALSALYRAQEAGKQVHVFVGETRPRLQGARLTAWELQKHGMQLTVITDNMAATLMRQGKIHKVIVGADRIAANGDVANKIGTYNVAIAARYHHIPCYVAAPCSTIDLHTPTGADIPIEERDPSEVTHIGATQITPSHVNVCNPAFDITPADLVTAIITERGIAEAPYDRSLAALVQQ